MMDMLDSRCTSERLAPMSNTPEEHEPRTDAKRFRREGLVDVGLPLAEFPSDLFDLLAHPSPTYANDSHSDDSRRMHAHVHVQPHSSLGQQLSDITVVPLSPRHAPRPPSSSSRRPPVHALAAAIDAPLPPHQAGQKRRREDEPSETLSQTSYSDAESATCTDAGHISEEGPIDLGLKLAEFPSDLLVFLAETLGNPLALLVSKAHLSKSFCEAARAAQGLLTRVDLCKWHRTVDDAVVAAVVPKCSQLTSLNLHGCRRITDEAVKMVASECKQLSSLNLRDCDTITKDAVKAVTSGCKQLSSLDLQGCDINDAAVMAVASECNQLSSLNLSDLRGGMTDRAVVAVASGCKQLERLNLAHCDITDLGLVAVASECKQLTTLNVRHCPNLTDAAVAAVASGCKQLTTLNLYGCRNITDAAVRAVISGSACKQLTSLEVQWLRMQWADSAWLRHKVS